MVERKAHESMGGFIACSTQDYFMTYGTTIDNFSIKLWNYQGKDFIVELIEIKIREMIPSPVFSVLR